MAATMKLYVGNLPWSTSREELAQLFSRFGQVEDAFLPLDRETGRPRGFGFVTMDAQAAQAACNELNETDYNGRQIKVREADPPGQRRGGFGGQAQGGQGQGWPAQGGQQWGGVQAGRGAQQWPQAAQGFGGAAGFGQGYNAAAAGFGGFGGAAAGGFGAYGQPQQGYGGYGQGY